MKEKQLQEIIAESMHAGSLLADQNYGGSIESSKSRVFAASLMKLKTLTQDFTETNDLGDIDIDKIFPVHPEIEELLNSK